MGPANTSLNILWGVENAAFSPALKDPGTLKHFDYIANSNIRQAVVPISSIFDLPPHQGYDVPAFEDRHSFAMFAWSHCEPVRTEYAGLMMEHAKKQHDVKITSMGHCLNNDPVTLKQLETNQTCPDYLGGSWEVLRRPMCDTRSFPDVAARSYKFSLVFQNADCDYWVDLRLQTAWASGSIVVFMGTKKSLLKDFIPAAIMDSMMFVEDYASPAALVDAMAAVNEAEFRRRMAWTSGYDRSLWDKAFHGREGLPCKLCALHFEGALPDGHTLPKGIEPDTCARRRREDWLLR